MRWMFLVVLIPVLGAGCGPGKPVDPRDAEVEEIIAKYPDSADTRVMVLGLDSADLDVIEPMVKRGELPAFARLMREGAYGKLKSQAPLLSPIIWTTIATGKPMNEHGVMDFIVENPETKQVSPISSFQRRTEAFWDIAGRYGSKVGVVGWLASWPAEKVNGFMVSERVALLGYEYARREDDPRERKTWPEELYDRIEPDVVKVKDVTYEQVSRFIRISEEEFRKKYERRPNRTNLVNNFRIYLSTAETFGKVGLRLWEEEKPRVMAWYFNFPDAASHLFMPYAPPRREHIDPKDYERYKDAVAEVYRYTDEWIGKAIDALDENTVLLLVSDHGFRSGRLRLKKGSQFHDRAAAQWHRMFGTFMAYGKGVRRGVKVRAASIFDITPTVLGLLGHPKGSDMPGRFLSEVFDVTPPSETIATYERGERKGLPQKGKSAEDDIQLAQLEALGYIGKDHAVSSQLNLGTFHMSRGEYEKALEALQQALLKQPKNARLHNSIGECYGRLRRVNEAEESFREAISNDPDLVLARLNLARMYWVTGKFPKAEKEFSEAIKRQPGNVLAWVELGKMWVQRGDAKRALQAFARAVESEPDDVEARYQLGKLLLRTQQYDAAETHLRAAVEREPNHRMAWNSVAVCIQNRAVKIEDPQKREEAFDQAIEIYTSLIERFPKYAKPYGNRARIRFVRGQFALAKRDAAKALELDPEYEAMKAILNDPRGGSGR